VSLRGSLAGGLVVWALVGALARSATALELPGLSGWVVAGTAPRDYEVRLDPTGGRHHSACAELRARVAKVNGFVTLTQTASMTGLRGKRLRLSAWIKSEKVVGWAGFWMRIDNEKHKVVAFDNMQDRAVRGSTEWTTHSIVLKVPRDARKLLFGVIMEGTGAVWVDDFEFSLVGPEVPVTDFFEHQWKRVPRP
jgi:hypothetical protein